MGIYDQIQYAFDYLVCHMKSGNKKSENHDGASKFYSCPIRPTAETESGSILSSIHRIAFTVGASLFLW
jgi:hypothetical protein